MAQRFQLFERNQEATIYVGNLDPKVNEEILWELFTQAGPVQNIHVPRDKITNEHQGYGFIELRGEEDADYAIKIMHMVKLYGKPLKVNKASQDKRTQDVGATLFIGNLSTEVDDKQLYDTFSVFGQIISTKIMRDPETGKSKGYGFVSFDSFESSDQALSSMNGVYFNEHIIHIQYALKKDSKVERHGTEAERLLAANRPDRLKMMPPIRSDFRPLTDNIYPIIDYDQQVQISNIQQFQQQKQFQNQQNIYQPPQPQFQYPLQNQRQQQISTQRPQTTQPPPTQGFQQLAQAPQFPAQGNQQYSQQMGY